ncbi:MAG: hypothetical protein KF725_15105 [Cyclobacteriaceae bacterium]|nr:hypothetical protein [Cyclobacteriaceae bacterium]UYN87321.1 MAG: hypothetical protein KIT51_03350 [Cyclobacteriaceae bacterium]
MKKTVFYVFNFLFLFLISCSDNDQFQPSPSAIITFIGNDGELLHTGRDKATMKSYFYKTDYDGKIKWIHSLKVDASSTNKICPMADGSALVASYSDGIGQLIYVSPSGIKAWEKTTEFFVYNIFLHNNEFWLTGKKSQGLGMVAVNKDSGEVLAETILNDFQQHPTIFPAYKYFQGVVYLVTPVEQHLSIVKLDKSGEIWRKNNNDNVPAYAPKHIEIETDGTISVFVYEKRKIEFDVNGDWMATQNIFDEGFTLMGNALYHKTSSGFHIFYTGDGKIVWLTLSNSFEILSTRNILTGASINVPVQSKGIEDGMLLSIYGNSFVDGDVSFVYRLSNDGTISQLQ